MREEFDRFWGLRRSRSAAPYAMSTSAFSVNCGRKTPHVQATYRSFANVEFAPKPLQKSHPPIWTGGERTRRTDWTRDGFWV